MRLLACDFDGTVFRDGTVSAEDLEALARWRAGGDVFGIVTGRGAMTLLAELVRLPLACDFLLCNNGAVLLDGGGRVVAARPLGRSVAARLLGHGAAAACTSCAVFSGAEMFLVGGGGMWVNPAYRPGFVSRERALSMTVAQISFGFAERDASLVWGARLAEDFRGEAGIQCSLSVADATAPEVDKASGVEWAARVNGWAPAAVLAAGDDGNDVGMLSRFRGYAMEGSAPDVVGAAGRTVSSVAELVDREMRRG